jgi:hypothetical protein
MLLKTLEFHICCCYNFLIICSIGLIRLTNSFGSSRHRRGDCFSVRALLWKNAFLKLKRINKCKCEIRFKLLNLTVLFLCTFAFSYLRIFISTRISLPSYLNFHLCLDSIKNPFSYSQELYVYWAGALPSGFLHRQYKKPALERPTIVGCAGRVKDQQMLESRDNTNFKQLNMFRKAYIDTYFLVALEALRM